MAPETLSTEQSILVQNSANRPGTYTEEAAAAAEEATELAEAWAELATDPKDDEMAETEEPAAAVAVLTALRTEEDPEAEAIETRRWISQEQKMNPSSRRGKSLTGGGGTERGSSSVGSSEISGG